LSYQLDVKPALENMGEKDIEILRHNMEYNDDFYHELLKRYITVRTNELYYIKNNFADRNISNDPSSYDKYGKNITDPVLKKKYEPHKTAGEFNLLEGNFYCNPDELLIVKYLRKIGIIKDISKEIEKYGKYTWESYYTNDDKDMVIIKWENEDWNEYYDALEQVESSKKSIMEFLNKIKLKYIGRLEIFSYDVIIETLYFQDDKDEDTDEIKGYDFRLETQFKVPVEYRTAGEFNLLEKLDHDKEFQIMVKIDDIITNYTKDYLTTNTDEYPTYDFDYNKLQLVYDLQLIEKVKSIKNGEQRIREIYNEILPKVKQDSGWNNISFWLEDCRWDIKDRVNCFIIFNIEIPDETMTSIEFNILENNESISIEEDKEPRFEAASTVGSVIALVLEEPHKCWVKNSWEWTFMDDEGKYKYRATYYYELTYKKVNSIEQGRSEVTEYLNEKFEELNKTYDISNWIIDDIGWTNGQFRHDEIVSSEGWFVSITLTFSVMLPDELVLGSEYNLLENSNTKNYIENLIDDVLDNQKDGHYSGDVNITSENDVLHVDLILYMGNTF
jgi:hypothetical protein